MIRDYVRRRKWTPARTAALVLGVVLTPGAVLGALLAWLMMFPEAGARSTDDPARHGMAFVDVSVVAADGVRLIGWDIPGRWPGRVVVVVHGSGALAAGHLAEARILHDAGFTVVMANLRRHGGSGKAMKTFGVAEAKDVRAFVDYACGRYRGCRVGAYGASMGAVATLLEGRNDERVVAVVADSGFASIGELVRHRLREAFGSAMGEYMAPFTVATACVLARSLPGGWNAARAAGARKSRPLLIIHGSRDTYLPASSPYEIKAEAPGAELWIVPGAEHCQTRMGRDREYGERIVRFFGDALTGVVK